MSTPIELNPTENERPRRRIRRTTAAGIAAGLLGGGAVGLILTVPGLTNAASDSASTDTTPATTVPVPDDSGTVQLPPQGSADDPQPAPGTGLREALQPLVDDGTITATQADAVAQFLAANRPERGPHGDHGGFGHDGGGRGPDAQVLAGALGIDVATLHTELAGGSTIAELAAKHGVEVQTVIDALVADAKTHLDQAVQNGRITQAQADTRLTAITQRITDMVNNGGPQWMDGRHGPGGPGDDDQANTSTTDQSSDASA
jgi:hypothetical protein